MPPETRTVLALLLVAIAVGLAGCGGADGGPSTPTPTETSTPTPTPTATETPTPTSTPTPTPTATATPTATPEPTPTATPTPEQEYEDVQGDFSAWDHVTHDETRVAIRIDEVSFQDTLTVSGGDEIDAPDGEEWVVAEVRMSTSTGDPIEIGHDQWQIETGLGERVYPDDQAMREMDNAYPQEELLRGNTERAYRVAWLVENPNQMEYVVVPYGDQQGNTLRIS